LLVPSVAGGSATVDADLREASLAATRALFAAATDAVVVVAPTTGNREWPPSAASGFSGFGLPREHPVPELVLPWPLGIGAWLLDEAGWRDDRRYLGVDGEVAASPDELPATVGVLAVGDGTACRTEKAPGYLDERAAGFDQEVGRILATGDPPGFDSLDAALAGELLCRGLPVWRCVAGLVGAAPPSTSELVVDDARYGVGYFVASWRFD
jgi:hypothetical protein